MVADTLHDGPFGQEPLCAEHTRSTQTELERRWTD